MGIQDVTAPFDRAERHANGELDTKMNGQSPNNDEITVPISRIEFDDVKLIDDGMEKARTYYGDKATVDIYYSKGAGMTLVKNVNDDGLEQILQAQSGNKIERAVQMCFITTPGNHTNWMEGNFSIPADTVHILREAGMSNALLSNIYAETSYWAKMGDQQFSQYDEGGNLTSFEICYQYRCGWHAAISFTHMIRTPTRSTYFCINYPEKAFNRLRSHLEGANQLTNPDFLLDILAADVSSKKWLVDINTVRGKLRTWEAQFDDWTATPAPMINFNDATHKLHRLSREWLSISQDCEDFQVQLAFLKDSYTIFTRSLEKHTSTWQIDKATNICDLLKVLQSQNDICMRWTKSYRERTGVCINLLFHLANQAEARTSKEIQQSSKKMQELTAEVAIQTREVAKQTQRDSASMITIATMTLLFLPGTFISSIMSTTFFGYEGDGPQVSKKSWILLPAILVLTIIVFGVWLSWLRRRRGKDSNDNGTKDP